MSVAEINCKTVETYEQRVHPRTCRGNVSRAPWRAVPLRRSEVECKQPFGVSVARRAPRCTPMHAVLKCGYGSCV